MRVKWASRFCLDDMQVDGQGVLGTNDESSLRTPSANHNAATFKSDSNPISVINDDVHHLYSKRPKVRFFFFESHFTCREPGDTHGW